MRQLFRTDKFRQHRQGFTIAELLIVTIVIGILATITLVIYNGVQSRAQASRSISDLNTLNRAIQLYLVTNGNYPPVVTARNSNDYPTDYVLGLVPNIITVLPKPAFSDALAGSSYEYSSDLIGSEYSIVATGGKYDDLCYIVRTQHPKLAVAGRTCWAYGYWTPGYHGLGP